MLKIIDAMCALANATKNIISYFIEGTQTNIRITKADKPVPNKPSSEAVEGKEWVWNGNKWKQEWK